MATLLEGKIIAEGLKVRIKNEIGVLRAKCGRVPKLVALQIGENASSAL
jgi:5,10-methylene-tetrahydrofolate dehydrogenase/methenyl tetrahydrofolate cyclohydrolase